MDSNSEVERMTGLKDNIKYLCELYIAEQPIRLRAHGIMSALLWNASMFKGMFDAQGIETVDDDLKRLIAHTEHTSKLATEQSLNRMEVEK